MLRGRTAVITGSTSGIGKGIAETLAANGCSIMLHGLGDRVAIERQRCELVRKFEVAVFYNGADLSLPSGSLDLVEDANTQMGHVDILVNNAGLQHVASIEAFPVEQWNSILAVNLTAAFCTIRAVLPSMRRSGWGRIINIASTHGVVASVGKSAYVAAKHGLVGLTKVVALEAANSRITSNAICPGFVETALIRDQIKTIMESHGIDMQEATHQLLRDKQPSGVFTTVEQVSSLVLYLCGEGASNLTGAVIPMDGGWLAQ